ncbi:MAG: hypothetical protein ABR543_18340 [Gemmatimonadaceae bacterium]
MRPAKVGSEKRGGERGPSQLAIGCLLALPGFFGGGMITVLLLKFVSLARGCRPLPDLPACNMEFMFVGAVFGAIVLPGVVVWRIRRTLVAGEHSQRS